MRPGIQTLLAEAGEAACYALDLIKIGETALGRELDVVGCLERGIAAGAIHYNETDQKDLDNFFVEDAAKFLTLITGEGWTVEKVGADYIAAPGDFMVDRWELVEGRGTTSHFRLPDWDSLVSSRTVKLGKIVSRRKCRRRKA